MAGPTVGPGRRAQPRDHRVAAANLRYLQIADDVVGHLRRAGVPALYLKGSAYLDTLYQLDERPMSDVDILIRAADRAACSRLLEASGYRALPPPPGRAHSWPHHYNWPFVPAASPDVLIEVHVELCQPGRYRIDYGGLWRRARELAVRDRTVAMLGAEDSLLHASVHELKHSFDIDPARREDIARMIAAWPVDWQIVTDRAREWGIATGLYVTLYASACAEIDVPTPVLDRLRPSRATRRLLGALIDLDRGVLRLRPLNRATQGLAMAATADRPGDFLRFAALYARKRWRDLAHRC